MAVRLRWPDRSVALVPSTATALERAAERLTRAAVADLRASPRPLYDSGVYYFHDPRPGGIEQWRVPSQIRERADCKVLAAWRAAELRIAGDERARVHVYRTGPRTWHAVTEHGDGRIEDPSRILGMESVAGVGADREYVLTWQVRKVTPTEWRGEIRAHLTNGDTMTARGRGRSRHAAIASAVNTATSALDNPTLRALLPPQATAALAILRSKPVAKAAKAALRLARGIFHF